jgi:hypothetical protein
MDFSSCGFIIRTPWTQMLCCRKRFSFMRSCRSSYNLKYERQLHFVFCRVPGLGCSARDLVDRGLGRDWKTNGNCWPGLEDVRRTAVVPFTVF